MGQSAVTGRNRGILRVLRGIACCLGPPGSSTFAARMRLVPVLLSALLLTFARPGKAAEPFAFDATPGKLPKDIVPRHYAVELTPDIEKLTHTGAVTIDLEIRRPTRRIVLNAFKVEVTRAILLHGENSSLTPKHDAAAQTVTFDLPAELPPGRCELRLEFRGTIAQQAEGLYADRYPTASGEKKLLATQMEPVFARRMFPCWDEPAFRATFELRAVIPEKWTAMFNMPQARERPMPGRKGFKEVRFDRTPAMPVYLFVFAAGEFEALEDEVDGVKLRILTTEGKKESGRYALEITKDLLRYYNDYFGVKYPLPKLDQLATPGGFGGAMENWGGIIYNEARLLFDPARSSEAARERTHGIVAHEIAHQWFGNLVTMAWWDDLWLNEGFATWMGRKAGDHFNPTWELALRGNADRERVMPQDARGTTHPIQRPVRDESGANQAFDDITYVKGQAFLRMLETLLGPDKFRAGMRLYMLKHKFSNTTSADLWAALEEGSGQPVRAIAKSWTEQPGFPVLSYRELEKDGKPQVEIKQERFTAGVAKAEPLEWKIPISAGLVPPPAAGVARENFLLTARAGTFPLGAARPRDGARLKLNLADTGYFRVELTPAQLAGFRDVFPSLPTAEKLNLLGDVWAMVVAGRAEATAYLSLVETLRAERSLAIWESVGNILLELDLVQDGQSGQPAFRTYATGLVRPVFESLGWDPKPGESRSDRILRLALIDVLIVLGDKTVVEEAQRRFAGFLEKPDSLSPDLRPPVVRAAGRFANAAVFEELHARARAALRTEDKRLYYDGLQQALDPELAARALEISLTDEMRPAERNRNLARIAEGGRHARLAWNFFRKHDTKLLAEVDSFRRHQFIPHIVRSGTDAALADEVVAYVTEKQPNESPAEAQRAAEVLRERADLRARALPQIDAWLRQTQRKPE